MFYLILRIIAVIIGCMSVWTGIDQMNRAWKLAPIADLASRIENGVLPEPGFWPRFDALVPNSDLPVRGCGDNAIKAWLTVSLARFDSLSRGPDLPARDAQRRSAIAKAKAAIACGPMNGNAWFRLGLLELGVEGPTPDVISYFETANRLSPAEGWLVRIRTPVYADLASRGLVEFRDQAVRDIEVFTAYGYEPDRVLNWLAAWPDLLRAGVSSGLKAKSLQERRAYFKAASNLGIDIGQKSRSIVVVDPFSGKSVSREIEE